MRVDIHRLEEDLESGVFEQTNILGTRIVDQDVLAYELVACLVDDLNPAGFFGHILLHGQHAAALPS